MRRYILRLRVYNYDARLHYQTVDHKVESIEAGRALYADLLHLMGYKGVTHNNSDSWLQEAHGIFGFVDEILGLFEQTETLIAFR